MSDEMDVGVKKEPASSEAEQSEVKREEDQMDVKPAVKKEQCGVEPADLNGYDEEVTHDPPRVAPMPDSDDDDRPPWAPLYVDYNRLCKETFCHGIDFSARPLVLPQYLQQQLEDMRAGARKRKPRAKASKKSSQPRRQRHGNDRSVPTPLRSRQTSPERPKSQLPPPRPLTGFLVEFRIPRVPVERLSSTVSLEDLPPVAPAQDDGGSSSSPSSRRRFMRRPPSRRPQRRRVSPTWRVPTDEDSVASPEPAELQPEDGAMFFQGRRVQRVMDGPLEGYRYHPGFSYLEFEPEETLDFQVVRSTPEVVAIDSSSDDETVDPEGIQADAHVLEHNPGHVQGERGTHDSEDLGSCEWLGADPDAGRCPDFGVEAATNDVAMEDQDFSPPEEAAASSLADHFEQMLAENDLT